MTQKNSEVKYATFTGRMLASVIDTLLSALFVSPLIAVAGRFLDVSKQQLLPQQLQQMTLDEAVGVAMKSVPSLSLEIFIMAVIIVIFWTAKGGTPGKMLMGMKIVDAKTFEKPSALQSIVRYLGYFVSVATFMLGFVWIYYDRRGQGFHDKIAGTVVIMEKKKRLGDEGMEISQNP